ncbi:MAG: endolytic transglycosylase MltG [Chromatiales bacterium]|jgi:UPF0755 protein|nr:endolytic transglycosylase MltG [Chromatiales bacterium]MDX9765735.1 endolytic transglycosylase MltG [Ectothiorhodospiraceae bacterium]
MMRLFRVLGYLLLIPLAAAIALGIDYFRFLDTPLHVEEVRVFEVPAGSSVRRLAQQLAGEGVLERPRYLELYARMAGAGGRVQAGQYRLEPGLTPRMLMSLMVEGRTVQYPITIVEGWTFRQMMQAVQGHAHLSLTLNPQDPAEIMTALGRAGEHPEGWFFPDTYLFPRGGSDLDLLRRAHARMVEVLQREWDARAPDLPLKSPYEALILASLVEKETGVEDERALIAGVFVNRLRRGMRLQTDPTLIYGMQENFDGNLRSRDLREDHPYNTYTRDGLPPTPIALPGVASIRAALHPAPTNALFFVSRGDGSHVFSATYDEHRQAVIRHQLGGDASRYPGGGGN